MVFSVVECDPIRVAYLTDGAERREDSPDYSEARFWIRNISDPQYLLIRDSGTYRACIAIPEDADLPEGVETGEVAGGTYMEQVVEDAHPAQLRRALGEIAVTDQLDLDPTRSAVLFYRPDEEIVARIPVKAHDQAP